MKSSVNQIPFPIIFLTSLLAITQFREIYSTHRYDVEVVGVISRVSVSSDGTEGNNSSSVQSVSADGRYVTYYSLASNLVVDDTNAKRDIFIHDRITGQTLLVSVASDGTKANDHSSNPSISGDGRFVSFESQASNLVYGDTNGVSDVFVHDLQTGQTERISIASDGTQGNGSSHAWIQALSADGNLITYQSQASNLVSGDTNGMDDIFVFNQQTQQTVRVSVDSNGSQGNMWSRFASISTDGRYVTFESSANNLVNGDTNNCTDIIVHDRLTGLTERISIASNGNQGNSDSYNPTISGDGRYVAYHSYANNLVNEDTNEVPDAFVYDRQTGQTETVSIASNGDQGNLASYAPFISSNERYVVFQSYANNLVNDDTNMKMDIFVHDRLTMLTERISIASDGSQGNDHSYGPPTISHEGCFVVFDSYASNLVGGDTNEVSDVFIFDRISMLRQYLPFVIH